MLVSSSSFEESLGEEEARRGSSKAFPASLIRIVKSSTITSRGKSSDLNIAIRQARLTDKSGTEIPAFWLALWQLNPKSINLEVARENLETSSNIL